MKLEELNVYTVSMELGEEVWDCVKDWDQFSKKTIGKQLVEAADSVAANISEGFGRFHYKEKIHTTGRLLNRYINSIGRNNNTINEDETPHGL